MASKRSDKIRAALERIRKQNSGRLTRQAVVSAARPESSVLHREFDWDDKTAGPKYRLQQAQELISRFLSVVVVNKSLKITAPYYVSDPRSKNNEGGYIALTSEEINKNDAQAIVLAEVDRCRFSIERARNVVGVLDARYPGLSAQLEGMLEELVEMRQRLAAA